MSSMLKVIPAKPDPSEPWYAEGIRFGCTGSGECCTAHGSYEYVFMSRAEERALAVHQGMSLREFRRHHTKRAGLGQRSLRFPGGKCTFLQGKRCTVYEVRPQQCRTWPFWPENMDRRVWDRDVAGFCAGVGRGRLYSREEIEAVLGEQAEVAED